MGWSDRIKSYMSRQAVAHEIEGMGTLQFYPNTVGQISKLKDMSAGVMMAVSVLLTDHRSDAAAVTETASEGNRETGFTKQTTTVEAVTPEVLEYRAKERANAISRLLELADKRNMILFGGLLMDSLTEEFPYDKDRKTEDVERFLYGTEATDALNIPLLIAMTHGWIKANSRSFGKMGKKMVGLLKSRLQTASLLGTEEEETLTSGQDLSDPSSLLSDTDSPSNASND